MTNNKRLQVMVDEETYEKLRDLAKADERTLSDYMRVRVKKMVDEESK